MTTTLDPHQPSVGRSRTAAACTRRGFKALADATRIQIMSLRVRRGRPKKAGETALGCLVAADRCTPSSHVLQILDGIPPEFGTALHIDADPPDLAVILTCDPGELAQRLTERGSHGRFEDDPDLSGKEVAAYRDLTTTLARAHVPTLVSDSTSSDTQSLANHVVTAVQALPSTPPRPP